MDIKTKRKYGVFLTPKEKRIERYERLRLQLKERYNVNKLSDIQVRYLEKGVRYQGIYDIETSDFNPYQNFIICFVFHKRDVITGKIEKFAYNITKKDITEAVARNNFDFDYTLLQKLSKCINSVDQIVGHFSTKFDNGYFKSRCLLTNQVQLVPDHLDKLSGDTWRMMKTTLKAPRNTLNNLILQATGSSQKTHVDLKYWYKVKFKDSPDWQKAMDYIVDHCKKDVTMTVKSLIKIEKFNSISGGSF